jgi:two-component system, OmpR family, response regulator
MGCRVDCDGPFTLARRMNVQSIKLLVIEDSSVLADRIAELIAQIPEIELIGATDSEAEALRILKRGAVHIVLLDLHLKQGTGFGILRSMSTLSNKPRAIVFTNHDSAGYESNALSLGATMFLDKARDFPRLRQILTEMAGAIDGSTAADSGKSGVDLR